MEFASAKPRDRAAIAGRMTRYEVALWNVEHPDVPPVVVGYTARPSVAGVLRCAQGRGAEIIAHCELTEQDSFTRGTKPHPHVALGRGWVVGLTGRTEREV